MNDKRFVPPHFTRLMDPEDRKKLGLRTWEESRAEGELKLERDLHTEFIQFLNLHRLGYYHAPMFKKSELEKGIPDFGIYRGSRILWIEFKVGKNKLDPDQQNKIAEMLVDGNEVRVCWSIEEGIRETGKFFNLN